MPGLKRQQDRGLDRLELVCRDRGIPVTVQRRVIFSALLERDDHPTVDQIYDDVKGRIPGVSRTTVYRTLEILSDLGLVRRTHHFEAFARFDGNMEHHHHLVCTACSKVVDVDAPGLTVGNLPENRPERLYFIRLFHLFRRVLFRLQQEHETYGASQSK